MKSGRWWTLSDPFLLSDIAKNSCGIASDDGICRNILGDNAAGTDDGVFPNYDLGKNGRTRADGSAFSHHSSLHDPVLLGLQLAVGIHSPRVAVIYKRDAVADEDTVFDVHSFADEGIAGDLAVLSDSGVLLNFDKGPYFRVIVNFAAVEINKLGESDILAQLHVRSNADVLRDGQAALSVGWVLSGGLFHGLNPRSRHARPTRWQILRYFDLFKYVAFA